MQQLPYAASARLSLARRLSHMAQYTAEARRVADVLRSIPGIALRPDPPHVNMFHATFDAPPAAVKEARDQIARDEHAWLFGGPGEGERPGTCKVEMSFGDGAAAFTDDEIRAYFTRLLADATALI